MKKLYLVLVVTTVGLAIWIIVLLGTAQEQYQKNTNLLKAEAEQADSDRSFVDFSHLIPEHQYEAYQLQSARVYVIHPMGEPQPAIHYVVCAEPGGNIRQCWLADLPTK